RAGAAGNFRSDADHSPQPRSRRLGDRAGVTGSVVPQACPRPEKILARLLDSTTGGGAANDRNLAARHFSRSHSSAASRIRQERGFFSSGGSFRTTPRGFFEIAARPPPGTGALAIPLRPYGGTNARDGGGELRSNPAGIFVRRMTARIL